MKSFILYIVILLSSSVFMFSKSNFEIDTSKVYKIETIDGSNFYGKLKEIDSSNIEITLASKDKFTIKRNNIIMIAEISIENIVDGTYRFPNPNPHVYFMTSSSIKMNKGEAYYQNTYVFLNSFRVAITDNLNIGGGIELLSLFGGHDPLIWLTPKYDFEVSDKLNASTSILFLRLPTSSNSLFGIWSVGATYGDKDHNVNFGLGYGFVDKDFNTNPAISISGMTRLSRKTVFVSENWFVIENELLYLMCYSLRFIGETMSFDIGFMFNHEFTEIFPLGIPYINFIFKL